MELEKRREVLEQAGGVGAAQPEPTLAGLLSFLFKHLWLIVVVLGFSLLGVAAYDSIMPPVYESRAKVMIKLGRENLSVNPVGSDVAVYATLMEWEGLIRSEIEIAKNHYLASKVVDELGEAFDEMPPGPEPTTFFGRLKSWVMKGVKGALDAVMDVVYRLGLLEKLPARESAISRVLGGMTVDHIPDSSVLQFTFRSINPVAAQKVLECFLRLYMDHHLEVYKKAGTMVFFQGQRQQDTERLRALEDGLAEFMQRNGIVDLALQKANLLNAGATLREKLFNFRLEEKDLLGRYAPSAPMVSTKRELIEETQREYDKVQQEVQRFQSLEEEWLRRQREVKLAEEDLILYSRKETEAEIFEAMDLSKLSNVALVEPAARPFRAERVLPMLPNRTLFLLVASILGLSFGVGLALLGEYLNPTVRSRQEMEERIGVPVWGVVGERAKMRG